MCNTCTGSTRIKLEEKAVPGGRERTDMHARVEHNMHIAYLKQRMQCMVAAISQMLCSSFRLCGKGAMSVSESVSGVARSLWHHFNHTLLAQNTMPLQYSGLGIFSLGLCVRACVRAVVCLQQRQHGLAWNMEIHAWCCARVILLHRRA